jgi:hypothetical protein
MKMKKIDKVILTELDSFVLTELQRVLEAVEAQVYYQEGYKHICGGFSDTEVVDVLLGEDCDEETDEEHDLIEFNVMSGCNDESGTTTHTTGHYISTKILKDKSLSLKEKLQAIKEA